MKSREVWTPEGGRPREDGGSVEQIEGISNCREDQMDTTQCQNIELIRAKLRLRVDADRTTCLYRPLKTNVK